VTQAKGRILQRGEKIVLREKTLDDARDDYAWRVDPELASYDAARPLRATFDEFNRLYSDELRYPSPYRHTFAVDDLGGKHIGNVMYYNIDERKGEAELGITIGDRDYWARGFGADTVRTFISYLFLTTSLNRIYLHTLDWNIRAQRSFRNAGFTALRTERRGGYTFILMEIRREDWDRDRPPSTPPDAA
jgi:RimJ/RimL family protein N-acetyltransferase